MTSKGLPILLILFNLLFLEGCSSVSKLALDQKSKLSNRSIASDVTPNCYELLLKLLSPSIWTNEKKELALNIMLSGSDKVSRTVALGRRFMAPSDIRGEDISVIAEENFRKAASFILENLESLEINKETAIKINRILTEGLVPEERRGNYLFRLNGPYVNQTDTFIDGDPVKFYQWLESDEGKKLFREDPVRFAETIHNAIAALDSFPDGNGRLSRMLSDLALMKSGRAPALYSSMEDYFLRGNARSDVSRSVRLDYYREIAENGQRVLDGR